MTLKNEYIHPKDQEIIKRLLTCEHYEQIAKHCDASYSTVNNLVNGRVKIMRHNRHIYLHTINVALLELEMFNMRYSKHLKLILK